MEKETKKTEVLAAEVLDKDGEVIENEYMVIFIDGVCQKYSVKEDTGGNELGQPDNNVLLKTLELNHQLLQGIAGAMKSSFAIGPGSHHRI